MLQPFLETRLCITQGKQFKKEIAYSFFCDLKYKCAHLGMMWSCDGGGAGSPCPLATSILPRVTRQSKNAVITVENLKYPHFLQSKVRNRKKKPRKSVGCSQEKNACELEHDEESFSRHLFWTLHSQTGTWQPWLQEEAPRWEWWVHLQQQDPRSVGCLCQVQAPNSGLPAH